MKTANKLLLGSFTAAAITIAGLSSGDYVLDKSVETNSLLGAQFAVNVLQANVSNEDLRHYALAGDIEAVKIFLEVGDKITEQDRIHAYYWATRKGGNFYGGFLYENARKAKAANIQEHCENVMELIKSYAETPEEAQTMMDNALEQNVFGDDLQMVEYVLQQGANPDANSVVFPEGGPRTLGWAATNRSEMAEEMVDLLLEYRANPQLGYDYLDSNNPSFTQARELLRQRVNALEYDTPQLKL